MESVLENTVINNPLQKHSIFWNRQSWIVLCLTRKCTDIPSWLLGCLGRSSSLNGSSTRGVSPKLLFHAVIDSCNVGCKQPTNYNKLMRNYNKIYLGLHKKICAFYEKNCHYDLKYIKNIPGLRLWCVRFVGLDNLAKIIYQIDYNIIIFYHYYYF